MKNVLVFSFLSFCLRMSLAQMPAAAEPDSIWVQERRIVVEFLASDAMAGRPAGSAQERLAADFIAERLGSALKVKVKRQEFEFLAPDSAGSRKAKNVYAFVNNHAKQTILIGAHYDHIGMGGKRSLSFGRKEIHNGADDNASGVALLLALAESMPTWAGASYNYLFVAYSAHEVGLFGSAAFLGGLKPKYKPLAMALNFDMEGRMHPRERWLKVYGVEMDTLLQAQIKEGSKLNFRFAPDETLDQLDTKAFRASAIPCLSFSTGIHDDYHKPSDDADKINYAGMWEVQMVVGQYLGEISKPLTGPSR